MSYSDEFWLLDVMAGQLSLSETATFYSWRTHRNARWARVLRRWAGKHLP